MLVKIERDKFYRTRDGRKVRVVFTEKEGQYPVVGVEGNCIYSYTDKGRIYVDGGESHGDLIAPWVDKPTIDRSILPAWANKAVAMDSDGSWWCYSEKPTQAAFAERWNPSDWCHNLELPPSYYPKWEGDWKDSLIVFEDEGGVQ